MYQEINDIRTKISSDLLLFSQTIFEKKTGRKFIIGNPISNEPHAITICRILTDVLHLKIPRLIINCPPGWHKSEFCKNFISWSMSIYPDSKYLYVSHSFDLATMHTSSIRQTMMMPIYKHLFNINILRDSSAKDNFTNNYGGTVAAFGSSGGITGHDAGLPGLNRFSGALIIDDIHKPDEVHSDTMREKVKRNYFETIERRLRSVNIPIIIIGQRLHEDDLIAHLLSGADGQKWEKLIITGLDQNDNAVYPEVNSKEQLITMRDKQPYVFYSQYQQNPIPAGGSLYKREDFVLLDEIPNILGTFITCDSAETDKNYNDATVFSFWGLYKINNSNVVIDDLYGLHLIDCLEIRVEPKDLESEFMQFWADCMRFKVQPKFFAIEKKSTGVTLYSVLNKIQGMKVIGIERSGSLNSKSNRFIELQQYIAGKQISTLRFAKHTKMFIDHMTKITANNTHRFDDICDTVYDAVKFALIDKIFIKKENYNVDYSSMANELNRFTNKVNRIKRDAYRG